MMKVAIFCIAMSVMTTCLVSLYIQGSSDYDYDTINAYRSELAEFSGGQLVNDNPWVLKGVYTPFTPGTVADSDIPNHIDDDNGQSIGWLYGEKITSYSYLDKVTGIKLDPNQKSNQLLTIADPTSYEFVNGKSWWNGGNEWGIQLNPNLLELGQEITNNENWGYEISMLQANNWNYTGYRYVFDPVLPFNDQGSAKDGRLSVVWYDIPNEDTGLSGALEVYASTRDNNQVKLGSISAANIISTVRSTAGYVQVFDFNFEGTHLNLTIQFDPTIYDSYSTLQSAWDAGQWSMSISSASAGNFFDVENSNAFNLTAGSMLDTFIQIYTFDYPHFENSWVEFIMWMLIGLPMTLGMLFITMRLVGGVTRIFGV